MLAETAVLRDADVEHAEELIEQALEVLEPDDLVGRFRALEVQATIAWVRGDLDQGGEGRPRGARGRAAGRAQGLREPGGRRRWRASTSRASSSTEAAPLIEQALLLAEESGSAEAKGQRAALRGPALPASAATSTRPRPRSRRRASTSPRPAPPGRSAARSYSPRWVAKLKGDLATRRERCSASRSACSRRSRIAPRSARASARWPRCSWTQGRIDEAERFALEARETVGPHDVTSLATTTMALGLVRAAQGRDDEAEELLREATPIASATEFRRHHARGASRRWPTSCASAAATTRRPRSRRGFEELLSRRVAPPPDFATCRC